MAIDFGKQVGPLPLGAWVIVVGGGLGIALWSRQNGGDEPEIVEDTSGDPGVGEGGGTPGWLPINPPSTGSDNSGAVYETNEEWARAAITWLIAQNYDPGVSNSAITKGIAGGQDISGNKMSMQEWALWSLALKKFGSPPQPVNVPPPVSVPGPVTPAPNPPPVRPPVTKPPVVRPMPTPRPVPGPTKLRYRTIYITPAARSLSAAVAAYNRKYGTRHTWQDVWNYNLKNRPASTVKTLKNRGPNKVYLGSSFWIPY
jgi:hypothetical protein